VAPGIFEVVHRPLISAEIASALARHLRVPAISVANYSRNPFRRHCNHAVAQAHHPLRIDNEEVDMSVQIIPGRDMRAGNRKARRVIRECTSVDAAVAIGTCAVGADLDTGNSSTTAVLWRPAPADRWLIPTHPIDPPYGGPDLSAHRARIFDQLYDELMRSSGCLLASKNASIGGGC